MSSPHLDLDLSSTGNWVRESVIFDTEFDQSELVRSNLEELIKVGALSCMRASSDG